MDVSGNFSTVLFLLFHWSKNVVGDFNEKVCKRKRKRSSFKIAKLTALETAEHVTASEIDIEFGVMSTLTKAIKEKKLSPLQVF